MRPAQERELAFARLRQDEPVARVELPDSANSSEPVGHYWAVTRHADVIAVSRQPDLFCSGEGTDITDAPPEFREFFGSMINMDDPRHSRLRRIVSRGFTPRQLELLATNVEAAAAAIIEDVIELGECDFVEDVAAKLPLRIIVDLMGIPRSEERFIFDRTNIILGATDEEYAATEGDPDRVADAILRAGEDLAAMVRALAAERLTEPRDDLITKLVMGEIDGENLTTDELASFFIMLVVGGSETTRNALAHGLLALTNHPDQRLRWSLSFDRLAPNAVEEILRWSSPVISFRRTVTRDGVRLGGQELVRGDKVVLYYGSANRDDAMFTNPERFDLGRTPNPHVTFGGGGPHYCLGAHLARREIAVMFRQLFRRMPDLEAVGEPDRLRSNFINGIKHLPARFSPRRAHT